MPITFQLNTVSKKADNKYRASQAVRKQDVQAICTLSKSETTTNLEPNHQSTNKKV